MYLEVFCRRTDLDSDYVVKRTSLIRQQAKLLELVLWLACSVYVFFSTNLGLSHFGRRRDSLRWAPYQFLHGKEVISCHHELDMTGRGAEFKLPKVLVLSAVLDGRG